MASRKRPTRDRDDDTDSHKRAKTEGDTDEQLSTDELYDESPGDGAKPQDEVPANQQGLEQQLYDDDEGDDDDDSKSTDVGPKPEVKKPEEKKKEEVSNDPTSLVLSLANSIDSLTELSLHPLPNVEEQKTAVVKAVSQLREGYLKVFEEANAAMKSASGGKDYVDDPSQWRNPLIAVGRKLSPLSSLGLKRLAKPNDQPFRLRCNNGSVLSFNALTNVIIIGKRKGCDVLLPDEEGVSRLHAMLFIDREYGAWRLVDVGGANGFLVKYRSDGTKRLPKKQSSDPDTPKVQVFNCSERVTVHLCAKRTHVLEICPE